ncbi:transcription factor grauzone-like isoform X2 [Eurosta solidaginis]
MKKDIEDDADVSNTNSPIESQRTELREPKIDLIVEQPISFAGGLDFEAVDMKYDDTLMDGDSFEGLSNTPADDNVLEENQLVLKTTKNRIYTKRNLEPAKHVNKKVLNKTSRSAQKNQRNGNKDNISEQKGEKNTKEKNCNKQITKALLRELDQYIAENTQLSCCLCSKSLTDFSNLKKHFRELHNCTGYIPCCKNRFVKRTAYVDHLKLHKDPDYFKCQICSKQLASRHIYQNHMYTIHPDSGTLLFPCELCPRKFAKQYILDYHIKSRHTTTKSYICSTCNKGFKNSAILKQHEKAVHLKKYDSICETCGKCFKTAHNLATHIEAIHNETPRAEEQCKICLKWLKNTRCLKKHMIFHRDKESGQEFKCPKCGIDKSTRHALSSHIRYHHSEKVFSCTICGKEYKNPRALKEHETIHTGTHLYTCSFCPKTFRSHGNMHKHKVNNHSQEYVRKRSQPNDVTKSLLNILPE